MKTASKGLKMGINYDASPSVAAYDGAYYDTFRDLSYNAGLKLLGFLRQYHPFDSVVDFGCGSGTWISAAKTVIGLSGKNDDLLGIDGEYARSIVDLTSASFMFADLEKRIRLPRKYALALCLEVAEHLSIARSASLIEDICASSDVVLFSSAIPGQGGTNHINEQWQEYWHDHFANQNFQAVDFFKEKFWNDASFERCPYYISNSFVYVRTGSRLLDCGYPIIPRGHWSLRVAHPSLFHSNHFETASLPKTIAAIPRKLSSALSRRLKI